MDFRKKELAPLALEAWEEIESEARSVLQLKLSARRVVDLEGPLGWKTHSVPLGRLGSTKSKDGVNYGLRQSLPMVELRVPFELDIWEMDNMTRGDEAADLEPLQEAAKALAKFEDEAVYAGLSEAHIAGVLTDPDIAPLSVDCGALRDRLPEALGEALEALKDHFVEGPYVLVASSELWKLIMADDGHEQGYRMPLRRQIEDSMGIKIVRSPQVDVNFLISTRGGDFVLTLGQDAALGYESRTESKVRLYFTETFTFRVNSPEAVVPLMLCVPQAKASKAKRKK